MLILGGETLSIIWPAQQLAMHASRGGPAIWTWRGQLLLVFAWGRA